MFVLNWLQDGTNDFLVKFADYIIYSSRPGLTYSCNKIGNTKIRITSLIWALPQIISIRWKFENLPLAKKKKNHLNFATVVVFIWFKFLLKLLHLYLFKNCWPYTFELSFFWWRIFKINHASGEFNLVVNAQQYLAFFYLITENRS